MSDTTNNGLHFSNSFGSVYENRLDFQAKKTWWAGGSHEEIPLKHVTSIRLETTRHPIVGVFLLLLGLGLVSSGDGAAVAIGLVLGLAGLGLVIGHPSVRINTAGQDVRHIAGRPGSKTEAEEFIGAVRQKLFKD